MADDLNTLTQVEKMMEVMRKFGGMRKDITGDIIREEYNEDQFWAGIKSYKIQEFGCAELLSLVKDMIAGLLGGNKGDNVLYNLCLRIGSQLKDPNDPTKLLLKSVEPVIVENENPVEIPTDLPGYWAEFEPNLTGREATHLHALSVAIGQKTKNLTADDVLVFGPFLAFLILRFERRSFDACVRKLANMKEDYTKLYPSAKFPDLSFPSNFGIVKKIIMQLKRGQLDIPLKNTVFKAMIFKRHDSGILQSQAGLLDFCLLQALKYSGMQLVTLVDEVMTKYGVNEKIIMDYTLLAGTQKSWRNYNNLCSKYRLRTSAGNSKYWFYAREFNHAVFVELTFRENSFLCGLMAALLDEISTPSDTIRTQHTAGPAYTNLFRRSGNFLGLSSSDDFEFVKVVAEDILKSKCTKRPVVGQRQLLKRREPEDTRN